MAGGYGGMGGAGRSNSSIAMKSRPPGNIAVARDLEGQEKAVQNVRNVGGKTFYLRAGTWVGTPKSKPERRASSPNPITPVHQRLLRPLPHP